MKTAIEFKNVSKKYFLGTTSIKETFASIFAGNKRKEVWALKDVSFEVKQGETLGIIGPNGAGKTTILKLIAGVTAPTTGEVIVKGKIGSLIELGAGFHPELTGRENIYLAGAIMGMKRKEIDGKFKEIVDFAELWDFIDTPVKRYSSGMYARLGFSTAIHADPEILLVDEVLAVGDIAFHRKCYDKIDKFKKNNKTVIFVSHNLQIVKQICTNTIWLNNGRIFLYKNAISTVDDYINSQIEKTSYELDTEERWGIRL